jgi:hypothetical protein
VRVIASADFGGLGCHVVATDLRERRLRQVFRQQMDVFPQREATKKSLALH